MSDYVYIIKDYNKKSCQNVGVTEENIKNESICRSKFFEIYI